MCNEINFPHILVIAHLIICFLYGVAELLLVLILFQGKQCSQRIDVTR